MNDQQRTAMQMALKALETLNAGDSYKTHNAATALREALAQPQGEWVDLTDDEVDNISGYMCAVPDEDDWVYFSQQVIAKFKEKNTPPVMPQSDFAAKIIAKALHYPECWDTAAYPTLDDAVIEAEVWDCYGCSVCKPQNHSGEATDMVQGEWVDLTDDDVADVFWDDFSKQREEDYTWDDVARAVIAKFKEKNTPPSVEAAIEATKEKAAKVCEEEEKKLLDHWAKSAASYCAAAIRSMK